MTGFLLDTNVICEPSKAEPNVNVLRWLGEANDHDLFLSALTFGEIRRGIALLPASKRRARCELFLAMLGQRFDGRILALDRAVAEQWGSLLVRCSTKGTPMLTIDSMLAATALTHGLTLVTRNSRDFRQAEISVIDPFK